MKELWKEFCENFTTSGWKFFMLGFFTSIAIRILYELFLLESLLR